MYRRMIRACGLSHARHRLSAARRGAGPRRSVAQQRSPLRMQEDLCPHDGQPLPIIRGHVFDVVAPTGKLART